MLKKMIVSNGMRDIDLEVRNKINEIVDAINANESPKSKKGEKEQDA